MKNIIFYKYVAIEDIEALQKELYGFCAAHHIRGKFLLAKEGINGCGTGEEKDLDALMNFLHSDERFSDMPFKLTKANRHHFDKLQVKLRTEIITSHFGDIQDNSGEYIEPVELKEKLDAGEELYLLDARNDYEYDAGHFERAINLDLKQFSDLPDKLGEIEHLKEKPIVMFCTAGVRCEKATALLKEKGFKDVKHIHGGIYAYGAACGSAHWKGSCYVFDNRYTIDLDPSKIEIINP